MPIHPTRPGTRIVHRATPTAARRRARRSLLPLSILASAVLAACTAGTDDGGGTGAASAARTVTDTVGDTIVVRTLGVSDSAATLRLVEELRIGEVEGADAYTFASIVAITPAPDGGVYVWDQGVGALRRYDADGRFVRQVGRQGSGPGEYRANFGLELLPDQRLAFWDMVNGRVMLYDTTGASVATWRATRNFYRSNGLRADTAGRLYLIALLDSARQEPMIRRRQGYVVHAADGAVLDTLVLLAAREYPGPTAAAPPGSPGGRSGFLLPFGPESHRTFSPLGYIASAEGDRYAITLHRAHEPPLRIERDVAPVPVEPDERDEQVEGLTSHARLNEPGWQWNGPPVPEMKPMIRALTVGADGRIWVRRSMPGERIEPAPVREPSAPPNAPPPARWREPAAYDVFEPDGRFVGHLPMPPRTGLRHMQGDRVWAVTADSLGVQYVARFRLEGAPPPTR